MKKVFALVSALMMLTVLFVTSSGAAPAGPSFTLSVHHNDPATSATGQMLEAWAESVRTASNGRLDFKIYHGGVMGGLRDSYDLLFNGTCDVAWINTSVFAGNFPLTEIMSLPLSGITNATQGSRVVWDLYKQFPEIRKEYENFHMLALHTNCSSPISTRARKITEISQLAGMNIRANAGPPTVFVTNLGAAPVSVGITELFEAINNNTIDAVITDWHAIRSFALYEAARYYLDENVSVTPFFMGMNLDAYNQLPEDLKAVLDSQSGDTLMAIVGSYWDEVEISSRQLAKENSGELYKLSDAERAKLRAIADKTAIDWIASKGGSAQQVFDSLAALIEKYK